MVFHSFACTAIPCTHTKSMYHRRHHHFFFVVNDLDRGNRQIHHNWARFIGSPWIFRSHLHGGIEATTNVATANNAGCSGDVNDPTLCCEVADRCFRCQDAIGQRPGDAVIDSVHPTPGATTPMTGGKQQLRLYTIQELQGDLFSKRRT